ncbi:hypothetical protein [Geobacter anodireducens]
MRGAATTAASSEKRLRRSTSMSRFQMEKAPVNTVPRLLRLRSRPDRREADAAARSATMAVRGLSGRYL